MIKYFDQIYYIRVDELKKPRTTLLRQRFEKSLRYFFPAAKYIIVNAVETDPRLAGGHHVGCAMSHRKVIKHAKSNGYERILIFEEDALLHLEFGNMLRQAIKELKTVKWDLFKLGNCVGHARVNGEYEQYKNCKRIQVEGFGTCTHSYALNHTLFDKFLSDLPESEESMREYVIDPGFTTGATYPGAIDMYMLNQLNADQGWNRLVMVPRIVTQDCLSALTRNVKQDYRWDYYHPGGHDHVNNIKLNTQEVPGTYEILEN